MDPDGQRTSTRAVLLAATGQNCWPPAGSYMAAAGQDLMAADTVRVFAATSRFEYRGVEYSLLMTLELDLPRLASGLTAQTPRGTSPSVSENFGRSKAAYFKLVASALEAPS